MILGLLLDGVKIPLVPMVIEILSVFVLIIGFVFLVYKHRTGKSIEAVDEARLKQFTHIVGWIFIIYALIELIAVFACISRAFPRASTFRRMTGSVLEMRRLNRQSGYSTLNPSSLFTRQSCLPDT